MCYLVKCADYFVVHLLYSLCLYVWSVCYWKRYSKNPPFWLWFCIFLFFILSSLFQNMFCYLSWILMSISLLRVHLIIILKIPSLTQLVFSSVQLLSCVQLFATRWTVARQAALSTTNSQSLLKLMSIESVMPSSNRILCHPLLLLPPIFLSTGVFWNESALHIRWPKYWSFSFTISPSSEHSGLISFRMDWLDLLAVQGTLKSLLQHHSSKESILCCSAFFTVQLSHPHVTTRKTIALTRWTFVGKVMSLLLICCLGWL